MNKKEVLKSNLKNRKPIVKKRDRNFLGILNTSAQVGTLIVVVLGYLFTVRPAFQYQLLQEKNAQSELDRIKLEDDLLKIGVEYEVASTELMLLESNLALIEEESKELFEIRENLEYEVNEVRDRLQYEQEKSNSLASEIALATAREMEMLERLRVIEQQVVSENIALENARWELFIIDLRRSYVSESTGTFGMFGSSFNVSISTYYNDASNSWPNLYLSILSSIDKVEQEGIGGSKYPKSYFEEVRSFVGNNIDMLRCERPDFNRIEERYYSDLESIEKNIIDEIREKMLNNDLELDYMNLFYPNDFEKNLSYAMKIKEMRLSRDYKEIVDEYWWDCLTKRNDFYNLLADSRGNS
ncbi:hypothetical protein CZ787_19200 [Halomonas citrativorans]|uniref:Uncharacterized protein n=1 Tax=Halomonas citrativorans TaxID=2742612 RepID=A0A1R4I5X4_9GAMM|nr:hypothetical protein [Halomonas citrativorans]SJN15247.1 hypothetical protein CZ787_19200 [Halomonas citrativorans]